MHDKWLPPLKVCCSKVDRVEIEVYSNLTMHFKAICPDHGSKGIANPFAGSRQMSYTLRVSKKIADGEERVFNKKEPYQPTLIDTEV